MMFCVRAVDGKPPQAIALAAPTCEHPLIVEGSGECVWCSPHSGDVLAVVDTCPTCNGLGHIPGPGPGPDPWTPPEVDCPASYGCDGSGLLVSGYVTAEAVPIVTYDYDGSDPVFALFGELGAMMNCTGLVGLNGAPVPPDGLSDAVSGGTAFILTPIPTVKGHDAPAPRDIASYSVGSPVRVEWITEQLGHIL